MTIKPLEIRRLGTSGVHVAWSDGFAADLTSEELRRHCPCAECKMKRGEDTHSAPLTPKRSALRIVEHTEEESLRLEAIWGVGQYALGIKWADGHDSGIYTFGLLRGLCEHREESR